MSGSRMGTTIEYDTRPTGAHCPACDSHVPAIGEPNAAQIANAAIALVELMERHMAPWTVDEPFDAHEIRMAVRDLRSVVEREMEK